MWKLPASSEWRANAPAARDVGTVGSPLGAQFRSFWIAVTPEAGPPLQPTVIAVAPLLKALIV